MDGMTIDKMMPAAAYPVGLCSQCNKFVPITPMRKNLMKRAIKKHKHPHIFCNKDCSCLYYNNITNEKKKQVRAAKRMDGI